MKPVLEIEDLRVGLDRGRKTAPVPLVRGVSLTLRPGDRAALVGESGSGKTLVSLSVMRLVAPPVRITGGRILLDGTDLAAATEREMEQIRGSRVAMIYQDPLTSLNPVRQIGDQIVEAIRAHERVPREAARRRAADLLAEVGVPGARNRLDDYPHQFSGGMRQRVMIAMAISCAPAVLIADEPTTALDVTTQKRIIEMMSQLAAERRMAVLFITHDLSVAGSFCDRINVMYAGRVVEAGNVVDIFGAPRHPYTRGLLNSICTLDLDPDQEVPALGGQPPVAGGFPSGCAFHPRCPLAIERCPVDDPVPVTVDGRTVECHVTAPAPAGSVSAEGGGEA